MKQVSLFVDAERRSALPALGVPGSKPTLSKAQKLFNKLIDRIASQRRLLLAESEDPALVRLYDKYSEVSFADERLAHYNHVLEEQLQRLQEELAEVTAPFAASVKGWVPRPFMPAVMRRALDEDVQALQGMLEGLAADLVGFRDINVLKSQLRHYRVGQPAPDELELLEQLLSGGFPGAGRRR